MKTKKILVFGGLLIVLVVLAGVGVWLGRSGNEKTASSATGTAVTGAAAEVDWDNLKMGVEVTMADDLDIHSLNVSLEQLNALPVYELDVQDDVEAYFREIARSLWGEKEKTADFKDETYTEGTVKQHEYTLSLVDEKGTKTIGDSRSIFNVWAREEADIENARELSDEEKDELVKDLCQQLHLGIWDGGQLLGKITKSSPSLYQLTPAIEGLECTKYYYQNSWDGESYGYTDKSLFRFDITDRIYCMNNLCSYDVKKKRKLNSTYENTEALEDCVKKIRERALLKHTPVEDALMTYTFHDAAVRYVFVDDPKDIDRGHCQAVPILELTGENNWYDPSDRSVSSTECAAAINLDTGEVMTVATV